MQLGANGLAVLDTTRLDCGVQVMSHSHHDEANAAVDPPPAMRRIVLIEDSEDLRGLLRELMAFCGYEVRVASSAREGIELIESCHPDVALVDIGLPDMDGYEVARRLRAAPSTG